MYVAIDPCLASADAELANPGPSALQVQSWLSQTALLAMNGAPCLRDSHHCVLMLTGANLDRHRGQARDVHVQQGQESFVGPGHLLGHIHRTRSRCDHTHLGC